MDRAQSLVRRNLVFAAAACVLLAVVILRPSTSASVRSTDDFPSAFPGFEPGKAKAISVERTVKKDGKDVKETIRLVAASADAWTIESSHGYPAQTIRVKTFLDSIRSTRAKAEPTSVAAKFPQFAGDGGFTEVRVTGDAGAPLASFGIGKSGAGGAWSDVYLRIDSPGGGGRIVTSVGFDTSGNRTEVASWVDPKLFPTLSAAMVAEMELYQPSKSRRIELVRGKKGEKDTDDPWDMTKPEAGKAVPNNVMGLVRAFVELALGDVVDAATGSAADAKYGFDNPDVVATARGHAPKEELEGASWKLIVGKKAEGKDVDRWYVRRGVNGKDEPFVFTVSDWALRDFRGEPSQWLEKKPEPPPSPPVPPAPAPVPAPVPGMGAEPAMGAAPVPPAVPPVPSPVPGMGEKPPAPVPGKGDKPPVPPTPAPSGTPPPPAMK